MKTAKMHQTAMGWFSPTQYSDADGFIRWHDNPKYERMSNEQLQEIEEDYDCSRLVRAAAAIELASRALDEWNKGNR